ncbi:MAG: DNA repair protein RecO [bacterium]
MSYHIYTTKSIVLRERPLKEADRVYTILTRDLGLIRASATGVRKEVSKLRSALEPFSLSNISLVKGKEYWRITSAALLENLEETLRGQGGLEMLARAFSLLEKLIRGESANPKLFDRIFQVTEFVTNQKLNAKNLEALEIFLVAGILFELGYLSETAIPENLLHKSLSIELLKGVEKNKKSLVKLINSGIEISGLS